MEMIRGVVLAGIAAAVLAAPATASAEPDGIRVLTWNTAFLYMKALPPDVPSPLECSACDPLELPPGPPGCICDPHMAMYPNENGFGHMSELERANHIADRILATDQEVVVLNEVFNPWVRMLLELRLGIEYPHYISRLRGHAVEEDLTLVDLAQSQAPDWLYLFHALPDLPAFMDYTADPGDSGLMIFSKLPFEPLEGDDVIDDTACMEEVCEASGRNNGGPLAAKDFAFNVYGACDEEDCWASKGVGLVRVATKHFDTYVAFTHMQADYPAENEFFRDTRTKQLDDVKATILGAIPEKDVADAFVVFAGDINIVGSDQEGVQEWSSQEWHDAFDPKSESKQNVLDGFFACGNGVDTGGAVEPCRFGVNGDAMLSDPIGFRHSPTDDFITNDNDDARLDYLAASHGGGRVCPQYTHIAYDLMADVDGGKAWLSDHLPVRGDFNARGDHCSPSTDPQLYDDAQNLHLLAFGSTACAPSGPNPACDQDETVTGAQATIIQGGGMQWFMIDQAGSYSIDVDSFDLDAGMAYRVYHHSDLSRAIQPFDEEEGEWGVPWEMPDPPYYIRTFATGDDGQPDREADNVAYQLQVHQHLCRTPFDACFIGPGRALTTPYVYTYPETVDALSEVKDLYFRFKTAGVANGAPATKDDPDMKYPEVDFFLEAGGSESHDCMTKKTPVFQSYNDPTNPTVLEEEWDYVDMLVEPTIGSWDGDADRDERWVAPELPTKDKGELAQYFIRITRAADWTDGWNLCNPKMSTTLGYDTTLSFYAPQKLQAWNTLGPGGELLVVHSGFDTAYYLANPPVPPGSFFLVSDMSGAVTQWLTGIPGLRGYYIDAMWPTLWSEYDSVVEGHVEEYLKAPELEWQGGLQTVHPMLPGDAEPWYVDFTDNPDPTDASYKYYYHAARCHLANEPACTIPE
jgi:hypothetical protein